MRNYIKDKIKDWVSDDEILFVEEAIKRIEKKDINALKRIEVNHQKCLDRDILFGPIDNMIEFLQSLKTDGYTSVSEEWSGYEDNDFYANKYEMETDDEAAKRLSEVIEKEIKSIKQEIELNAKKNKRIKELEAELAELKGLF